MTHSNDSTSAPALANSHSQQVTEITHVEELYSSTEDVDLQIETIENKGACFVVSDLFTNHNAEDDKQTSSITEIIKLPKRDAPVSQLYIFILSLYWLASIGHSSALNLLVIPIQVLHMVGHDEKGTYLGLIGLIASILSTVTGPIVGAMSDAIQSKRFGKRKPFVISFTIINVIASLGFIVTSSSKSLIIAYIICVSVHKAADVAACTPFQALLPDIVATSDMGMASGWFGFQGLLGALLGMGLYGALIVYTSTTTTLIAANLMLLSACIIPAIYEEPRTQDTDEENESTTFSKLLACPPTIQQCSNAIVALLQTLKKMLEPLYTNYRFACIFISRFMIQLGFGMLSVIAYYFMIDVLDGNFDLFGYKLKTAAAAATINRITLLVVGAVAAYGSGILSDSIGRVPVAFAGGILQTFALAIFAFCDTLDKIMIIGIFLGAGIGMVTATELAMANDVVPSKEEAGKYMGLWHLALTIPAVIANPIAGIMLDRLEALSDYYEIKHLGYKGVILCGAFCMLCGTFATLFYYQPKDVQIILPNGIIISSNVDRQRNEHEQEMLVTSTATL